MKREDLITLIAIVLWCVIVPALLFLGPMAEAAHKHGY